MNFFKSFLLILLILMLPTLVAAQTYLKWDAPPSTPANQPDGYIIYYTETANAEPIEMITDYKYNCKSLQTEFPMAGLNLTPGVEYQITVTCYNEAGESDHSNVIRHIQPTFIPNADFKPVEIKIKGTVTIQITQDQ